MSTYILVGLVATLAGAALLWSSRRPSSTGRAVTPPASDTDEVRPQRLASLPPTPVHPRIRTGVLSPRDFQTDEELESAGDALVERRRDDRDAPG